MNILFWNLREKIILKGFVLSQLLTNDEYSNTVIVVEDSTTLKAISSIAHNRLLFLSYSHSGIIERGDNRIIMCVNVEATSVPNVIDIPLLTKSVYENSLKHILY
jgi:hypothetical protein